MNPTIPERLARLRAALREHGVAACLLPTSDPHLSEYLPARWAAREWFSGFTGSAGTLVVTPEFAGLWADSRYWEQAATQLAGTGIEVMRIAAATSPGHVDWLATRLAPGSTVAVDGTVLGLGATRTLDEALRPRGIVLRTDLDLVAMTWPDRPALPAAPVTEHPLDYATRSRAEKLATVRAALATHGANWHLISTLDDIAWLFNLRGADVQYNPVFLAHALIGPTQATLFCGAGKIDSALAARLATDQIRLEPYEHLARHLAALPADAVLLIDPRRVTRGSIDHVPASVRCVEAINPSTLAKSRKSIAEAEHVRHAMERDGAALCAFFAWFEERVNRTALTELDIDACLLELRGAQRGFVCPSFATIAGFNANGAMPHYRATPEQHAAIGGDGLLLIDSGGQYVDGTTDITRVVPVGTPSAAQSARRSGRQASTTATARGTAWAIF